MSGPMMVPGEPGWRFDLCGGHLAIDFANTVSRRHTDRPVERLPTWGELVSFARQTGILGAEDADRRLAWERGHGAEAEAIRRGAVELREALYAVLAAQARERPPAARDLDVVNAWVRGLCLTEQLDWAWADGPDAPEAFLAPVVRAAVELLTAGPRDRIRICEADDCIWLFLDTSKNRSRRWCDMKQCGNRAKARRFQARQRA